MLWRIAPDMFQDKRYDCVTINEVHDEIYQTQKFKDRYSWRIAYKSKIKTLPPSISNSPKVQEYLSAISAINEAGVIAVDSGRCLDLSRVDKKVLACSLANGYLISTTERAMILFAKQEFPTIFKKAISPLEIINDWLKKRLIRWDKEKQTILGEWRGLNERPQPEFAKKFFVKLTKNLYVGS